MTSPSPYKVFFLLLPEVIRRIVMLDNSDCGRQNKGPQDVFVLFSKTYGYYLVWQKGLLP
jgi:hypothetical protein